MTDYSSFFPLFWLLPVTLQILLPLALFCGWTIARLVPFATRERLPEKEEESPALASVTS